MKLFLIFLFSYCSIEKPLSSSAEIRWQETRKLTFADFKETVPPSSPWAATTQSMINFSYAEVNGKLSNVVVYASFIPEKSWMKKRIPEVLGHEQVHFDITEVFARKFYHKVIKETSFSRERLRNLFKAENSACDEFQKQYDEETEHGTKEDMQEKWRERVSKLLETTPPYPSQEDGEKENFSHPGGK